MLKIYARKYAVLQHFFTNRKKSISHITFPIIHFSLSKRSYSIFHINARFSVIGYRGSCPLFEIPAHIRCVGEM